MVDKELLDAIGQMMDAKLATQKREIMDEVKALLHTEVKTKLNSLAEGQEEILRRLPSEEDMNIVDAASIFWRD